MPFDPSQTGEDLARSMPGMKLVQGAGDAGQYILQLLQRLGLMQAPQQAPVQDPLMMQRQQMGEPAYRQWLAQQGQEGQRLQDLRGRMTR